MKTFMEYITEEATTKYVAVQYDEATQRKLRTWAKENNFDLRELIENGISEEALIAAGHQGIVDLIIKSRES
jgi:3-methyladenine DNA glycosylase AlkC